MGQKSNYRASYCLTQSGDAPYALLVEEQPWKSSESPPSVEGIACREGVAMKGPSLVDADVKDCGIQ